MLKSFSMYHCHYMIDIQNVMNLTFAFKNSSDTVWFGYFSIFTNNCSIAIPIHYKSSSMETLHSSKHNSE